MLLGTFARLRKNMTVTMRRFDYDRKIEEMLETGTYTTLRGDPTAAQENS